MNRHHRGAAQKAAQFHTISYGFSQCRDDAHGGGFGVDHANGCFIGDDGGDGSRAGIPGHGNHVQAHRADAGHGFQLVNHQSAPLSGGNHSFILGHRNKGTGKAAHMIGGHHAALFYCIIQHSQGRRGAVGTAYLQAHFFQNPCHTVPHRRSGSQTQVNNPKGHSQTLGGLHAHQLTHPSDLEGGFFDGFSHHIKGLALHLLQRVVHHAGAGNAHVQHTLWLTHTVKSTCHKGVILHGIGKHHDFGAAHAAVVLGCLGGLLDNAAHFCNCIHVDTGFCGAHVDTGADPLCCRHGGRDGTNQLPVPGGGALLHQSREAANEIDAAGFGSGIQSFRNLHIGIGVTGTGHQGNGGNGNPLVDNGNSKFCLNFTANLHQILGTAGNLSINFITAGLKIRVTAVQQTDAHGDGADVQMLLFNHGLGFQDVFLIQHIAPSNPMHGLEDILPLHMDGQPHLLAGLLHPLGQLRDRNAALGNFGCHHHGKIALHDGLADIQNVDIKGGKLGADGGDDAHPVLADHGNDCFHFESPYTS